jgi:hypothetical protein
MTLRERLTNMAFALDCFLFSVCTLGKSYPSESFSSAAFRAEQMGLFYGKVRPAIDAVFGKGHCAEAYIHAKLNLPEDQR